MIIATQLRLIFRDGSSLRYSHVVQFWTADVELVVKGERDGSDGLRVNVEDSHYLDQILDMQVEFKNPIVKEATDYPDAPLGNLV